MGEDLQGHVALAAVGGAAAECGAEVPLDHRVHGLALPPLGVAVMFLIDRKGILRSVDARTNYEALIPQLLAEPAQ